VLNEQVRRILSWVTVFVVAVVLVGAMIKILTVITGATRTETALDVVPAEVTLCQREQVTFTAQPALADLEWAVTGGGQISPNGVYTAGDLPGHYEIQVAGPDRQHGRAVVHIIACTPTPTPLPTPTSPPLPTPTPQPTPIASVDPPADTVAYESGAPAAAPITGLDIRNASVAADGRVALGATDGLPAEVAQWVQPGEAVLWIALYGPIPEAPPAYTEWLFVLDLDGNTATGRPAGSRPLNSNLGDEAAIGAFYDPATGAYGAQLLIWDPAQQTYVEQTDITVRFQLDATRTLLAVALSLDGLQARAAQVAGVTIVPEAVRGRAATIHYTGAGPGAWVADFYP